MRAFIFLSEMRKGSVLFFYLNGAWNSVPAVDREYRLPFSWGVHSLDYLAEISISVYPVQPVCASQRYRHSG